MIIFFDRLKLYKEKNTENTYVKSIYSSYCCFYHTGQYFFIILNFKRIIFKLLFLKWVYNFYKSTTIFIIIIKKLLCCIDYVRIIYKMNIL